MPTSRCYNCGLPGHQTQACPRHGPRYPAPGKTAADYVEQAERVRNLIAQDIVNEHNANHLEDPNLDELPPRPRGGRRKPAHPQQKEGGQAEGN